MVCCLNPYCNGNNNNPINPDGAKYCQYCREPLNPLLRGRFLVEQVLGQGGFGRTYLAKDQDRMDQPCVVKQLLPQGGSKAVELFRREAEQLQRLGQDHPQIPTLEAYFQDNNALFLVQQYIVGETLAQELKRRQRFTEKQVRELLEDWLPLLADVHRQGVIHRDLKPDNVMRRQDTGRVVMIDFGISKSLQGSVVVLSGMTMAGTNGYAPFEQMESGEAYRATDLYAVGATCFHLLSGVNPGQLWLNDGYGWTKTWQNHLPRSISPELARVIDKCLCKDYTHRYQSAQQAFTEIKASTPRPAKPSPPQNPQSPQANRSTAKTIPVPKQEKSKKQKKQKKQTLWIESLACGAFYTLVGSLSSMNKMSLALAVVWSFAVAVILAAPYSQSEGCLDAAFKLIVFLSIVLAFIGALLGALLGAGLIVFAWLGPDPPGQHGGSFALIFVLIGAPILFSAWSLAISWFIDRRNKYKYTPCNTFWRLGFATSVGLVLGWKLYQVYPWHILHEIFQAS